MKKTIITIIFALGIAATGFGQSVENTKGNVDQRLRSSGRVNPSTLGMEFDLPLGSYLTRGTELPLGLSYSSKVWRFEADHQTSTPSPSLSPKTRVKGIYSERAAAGWTTSLDRPWIELTGKYNRFDLYGRPADVWGSPRNYVRRITVHLAGASHELRAEDAAIPLPTPGGGLPPASAWEGSFYSSDGSGMKYVQNSGSNPKVYRLYMSDGSYYDFDPGTGWGEGSWRPAIRLTDANGNYLQYNDENTQGVYDPYGSWTDQLGRVFPIMIPWRAPILKSNESDYEDQFVLPGMTGPYALKWRRLSSVFPNDNHNHETKYVGTTIFGGTPLPTPSLFVSGIPVSNGCSNPCNDAELDVLGWNEENIPDGENQKFDPMVLAEVILPNGAAYRFEYNEYGEIERIEYPTGGTEEFVYHEVASLAGLSDAYQQTNRGVETREVRENPSATPLTSTYTAGLYDDFYATTVTAPDGTLTATYMHRGHKPQCDDGYGGEFGYRGLKWGYDNVLAGRVYETSVFSSDNPRKIRQSTQTRWETTPTSTVIQNLWPAVNLQTNPRVHSTLSTTYDDSGGVAAATAFEYANENQYGSPLNVTVKKEYAFRAVALPQAVPTPNPDLIGNSTLVRRTQTTYETGSSYLARNLVRLPTQVLITDGATTPNVKAKTEIVYDESTYLVSDTPTGTVPGWGTPEPSPSPYVRGLATTTKAWPDLSGSPIQTHTQYDQFGNVRKTWDGNQNVSEIQYTDRFSDSVNRHTYAFPTKTISAVPGGNGSTTAFETVTTYEFETGLPTKILDPNGGETEMLYVDPLRRLTKVIAPNDAETITEYGEPSGGTYPENERFINVKTQIDSTNWKQAHTWFDGIGRTEKAQAVDAANGDVFIKTEYDNMNRVKKVSNPYRNGDTLYWTENTYDALGRVTKVKTTGDQAEFLTAYSVATTGGQIGTVETETDEAGKVRRTIEDAFDNVIRVDEPDLNGDLGTIASPSQPTVYTYDTNENLTQIVQGGQTRTFAYDALNRLKQATNPESGTFQFTYDANGNLHTKTDQRSITTTFTYDALNRVTLRNYSDSTPDVTYYYDQNGIQNSKTRLTKVTSSVSEARYTSFDANGSVLASEQVTEGQTYTFGYAYNLAGDLATQTYPSGKVVEFDYDGTGDLAQVAKSNGFVYANSFSYAPHGEVESFRFGNNLWETTVFNSRNQIEQIRLGHSSTDSSFWKTQYEYGDWNGSNIDPTKNNNGLARQTITVPTIGAVSGLTAIQTYTYDSLDRLKSATETIAGSQTWKQTFLYDRFGNRNFDTANTTLLSVDSTTPKVVNPEVLTSNNRFKLDQDNDSVDDYGYDAAGNLTKNAQGRQFTYNAENLQIAATGSSLNMSYAYDGNNKRVKSHDAVNDETTIFVYDADGDLSAEYTINVPAPTTPVVSYLTEDALGSLRVITNSFAEIKSRRDFLPFGEELYAGIAGRTTNQKYSSSTDDTRKKFATYQRDAETGLDFAQSRYFSPMHGRFASPDEFKGGPDELFNFEKDAATNPTFYADIGNPQSLNKFQYTHNNPYKYNDPSGHCVPFCVVVAVVVVAAILTGPDYAVAPTGRETPEENREYSFGRGNALLNVGGMKGLSLAGNVVRRTAVNQTRKQVARRVAKQGGNPFKGKTPKQVEKMFKKKGFTGRGPEPGGKKGGYVNPKTKRSYHIDPGGKYKKGTEKPHVDVNRKGSKRPKKKFPLE